MHRFNFLDHPKFVKLDLLDQVRACFLTVLGEREIHAQNALRLRSLFKAGREYGQAPITEREKEE